MDLISPVQETLLHVGVPLAILGLVQWVVVYTALAKWWRNHIGQTLVVKSVIVICLLALSSVDMYLPHLSAQTRSVLLWADIVFIWLIAPVMTWRSFIWVREHRGVRKVSYYVIHSDGVVQAASGPFTTMEAAVRASQAMEGTVCIAVGTPVR